MAVRGEVCCVRAVDDCLARIAGVIRVVGVVHLRFVRLGVAGNEIVDIAVNEVNSAAGDGARDGGHTRDFAGCLEGIADRSTKRHQSTEVDGYHGS